MLDRHLRAHTSPIALAKNCIYFSDFRITVLCDRLFRIEQSSDKSFLDLATLCIWHRAAAPQQFEYSINNGALVVNTPAVTLLLKEGFEGSHVIIDGKEVPLCNDGNLLGTARTLDCYDGDIYIRDGSKLKIDCGVCSRSGVAILDDTGTLCLSPEGEPIPAHKCVRDIYVFAFGNDYRAAVRALYDITGATPLLPRFAMGNWWSRYHKYTDEEYLHLMRRFSDADIPFSVAMLDMDWHYSSDVDKQMKISESGKNTRERGCEIPSVPSQLGWSGYSWNRELFPDYRDFLKKLKAQNLQVSLNLHPHSGVRYFEDQYTEMACAMGIEPESEQVVEFDIENTDFINNYFKILHNPYEGDGVDFWWIDWQQGTTSKSIGLDPLWALNHYHFADIAKSKTLPLIVSRYAGVGSHRYPVGFSGDTTISWQTLALMPCFTATASNIGYTWWGHDIGGHHLGIKDDELYLRFLQFGVFSPINRMHSTSTPMITKEPWAYQNGIGELAKEMLRLRHALIPFLYTCNQKTHTEGRALLEPMYYDYPEIEAAYTASNQYMFGGSLLVCPITKHSEARGLTRTRLWIPEGKWTDFFTGDIYISPVGGKTVECVRSLDSIPVLARSGAIIPLSLDKGNSTKNPSALEVRVYNGNGELSMYEDNICEDNSPSKDIKSALTVFTATELGGVQLLKIRTSGEDCVIPSGRSIKIVFPNICAHSAAFEQNEGARNTVKITVTENGSQISAVTDTYAEATVTIEDFCPSAVYEIRVEFTEPTISELRRRELAQKLLYTQCSFRLKEKAYGIIKNPDLSIDRIKNFIELSDIEEIDKIRLCETIM